eukprot:1195213-Prorocentrum_minimum.AAC.7
MSSDVLHTCKRVVVGSTSNRMRRFFRFIEEDVPWSWMMVSRSRHIPGPGPPPPGRIAAPPASLAARWPSRTRRRCTPGAGWC